MDEERGAAKTEEAGAEVATKDASGRRLCSGGTPCRRYCRVQPTSSLGTGCLPPPLPRPAAVGAQHTLPAAAGSCV
jgi:hypothetical protein